MREGHVLKRLVLIFLGSMIMQACSNNVHTIAVIDYSYSGCFSGGKCKMTIYEEDSKVMARLEEEGAAYKVARVSPLQMDTINLFVKDLKTLDLSGFCTTQENYTVSIENEVIQKYVGGCSWWGFGNLKKCLFDL